MSRFVTIPLELEEANDFVARHHRHHGVVRGFKFAIGCVDKTGAIVGVAIIGRPVARERQDGMTLEISRLCSTAVGDVQDSAGNWHSDAVCSYLYGAARRAVFAQGYLRLGTYILASEPGTSLKAAGYRLVGEVRGRSWNCKSRPRVDKHPTQDKLLFEA